MLMTVKEVAERLKISIRTVYKMLREKRIPEPYTDGRSLRWLSEEIEAFEILYWGLPYELPQQVSEQRLEEIKQAIKRAKLTVRGVDDE